MNIIDQRVLITAPAQAVWDVIRDISRNPSWQVDCESVSFITPRREGPGVRWRYSTGTGHECVVETTAWYNRLGYEYHFVDGMPFKQNFGRLRLQEIPEGTIVQWTFSYEPAGMFSGRRVGKQLELAIEENLATLKKNFSQSRGQLRTFESKSLMQDAPDVEGREHYKPRHPSQLSNRPQPGTPPTRGAMIVEPPIESGDLEPFTPVRSAPPAASFAPPAVQRITEPPIDPSDTRPRPAVPTAAPHDDEARLDDHALSPRVRLPDVSLEEPDFLSDFTSIRATEEQAAVDLGRFEPPISQEDTKPTSAVKAISDADLQHSAAATLETGASRSNAPTARATDEHQPVSPPAALPKTDAVSTPSTTAQQTTEQPKPAFEMPRARIDEPMDRDATPVFKTMPPVQAAQADAAASLKPEPPSSADDTATRSIWDIFGVPRPSEAPSQAAEVTPSEPKETETPAEQPTPPSEISEAPSATSLRAAPSDTPTPTMGDTTTYMLLTGRMGLRARRRRDTARLRRPMS